MNHMQTHSLCPNSKNAILRSCGAGIAAADSLIKNNSKRIFVLCDPQVIMQKLKEQTDFVLLIT